MHTNHGLDFIKQPDKQTFYIFISIVFLYAYGAHSHQLFQKNVEKLLINHCEYFLAHI
jgi:hypothetical protein